ncbi:MAG TPA: hypothetical protein VMX74_10870 [Pirellulales bacterium]|nr:hypothetical protein [Pirellulales bacterium]
MATSQKEIDDIVRRVLKKLSGPQDEPCTAAEKTSPDELVLHEPVISAGLLTERLNGARRLAIAVGTVITPAAHDVLRQHEVEIRTYENSKPSNGSPVTIGIVSPQVATASLREMLKRAGIAVNIAETRDVYEMIETLTNEVVKQTGSGIMITDETAAALCIANRRSGVRAVQAQDVSSMRSAATAVGANVLAIDPQGMSGTSLTRLIKEFIVGGPYVCPEGLRRMLN